MANVLTVESPSEGGNGGGKRLSKPCSYIVIAESALRKSGQKADYYNVCFRVVGRADGNLLDDSFAGSYFYDILSLSEKAMWKMGRLSYFLGHEPGTSVDLDDQGAFEEFFLDREAILDVKVEDDGAGYGARARWGGDGSRIGKSDLSWAKKVYEKKGEPYNEGWAPSDSFGGSDDGKSGGGKGGFTSHPDDDDVPF